VQPGFWIVEGFANMVEELEWDLEHSTWSPPSSRADSPDVVSRLSATEQIEWPKLVRLSMEDFAGLPNVPVAEIESCSFLGGRRIVTPITLFYSQAGTLASYLYHAEHGRMRPMLLDYLAAFYKSEMRGDTFEKLFAASATTLGEKAAQWAKELARAGKAPAPVKR
jgi:hypothetical protein